MKLRVNNFSANLIVLFFVVFNLMVLEAEVITLTEDTFTDKVKEKDTVWFVKFCVPWCKHCKKLGSLWEDLGKAMEGADEIEIGEVDCGLSKPVCSKVDIHSYPTFKAFYNGEEIAKYSADCTVVQAVNFPLSAWKVTRYLPFSGASKPQQRPRDVESLKTFILEEAEKAETNAQLENEKEL